MSLFKEMFSDFSDSLSEKEHMIFDFISSNIFLVSNMTIKELSVKLNVSEYSINKFCNKINLDNFNNLNCILKYLSSTIIEKSENIFDNSKISIEDFIRTIDEEKISTISKSIIEHNGVTILFPDSHKLTSQYFENTLKQLNIKTMATSSLNKVYKDTTSNIVIYITESLNEYEIKSSLDKLSNKTVIVLSKNLVKEIHDKAYIFINVKNVNIANNYNVNLNANYFVLIDLISSKLIELKNSKN